MLRSRRHGHARGYQDSTWIDCKTDVFTTVENTPVRLVRDASGVQLEILNCSLGDECHARVVVDPCPAPGNFSWDV